MREGDVELLARKFAAKMALELGWREVPDFSDAAMQALENHDWPGNIRELKNVVERAVYASGGSTVHSVTFDPFISPFGKFDGENSRPEKGSHEKGEEGSSFVPGERPLNDMIRELEVEALKAALEAAKFHQGEAAGLLGLSYHQFRGLYRKHKEAVEGD